MGNSTVLVEVRRDFRDLARILIRQFLTGRRLTARFGWRKLLAAPPDASGRSTRKARWLGAGHDALIIAACMRADPGAF